MIHGHMLTNVVEREQKMNRGLENFSSRVSLSIEKLEQTRTFSMQKTFMRLSVYICMCVYKLFSVPSVW